MAWNSLAIDKESKKISDIDEDNLEEELNNNGNNTKVDYLENNPQNDFLVTFLNTSHQFIVDKNGSISFNGNNVELDNSNKLTANNIVNNSNASEYFGKYVTNYVANTKNDINYNNYNDTITNDNEKWQIFYIGDAGNGKNQIYLISSNYINHNCMPSTIYGTSPYKSSNYSTNLDNIVNDYLGTVNISQKTRYLNKLYFDANKSSENRNMKECAYMLDADIWSVFANEYADFAIGSPTMEILFKSYNEKYNKEYKEINGKDKLQLRIASVGYERTLDGGANWTANSGNLSTSDSTYVISSTSQADGLFIASPHTWENSTYNVYNSGYTGYYLQSNGETQGLRPLICLNSDVELEKDGDNYKIVSGAKPTFNVTTQDLQNGTTTVTISDINYKENNAISNWQVKYKKESESNWQSSNSLSFNLNNGVYNIKVFNGNIESPDKRVFVGNYINLEFLQSSGSQNILTDIILSNTFGASLKFSSSDTSNDLVFFGSKGSNDNRFWIGNTSNKLYFGWNTPTNASIRPAITKNTIYTAELNFKNSRTNKLFSTTDIANGTYSFKDDINNDLVSNSTKIAIFAGNQNGTIKNRSKINLYNLKFSDGTNIIHEFIPVFNTIDHSLGLCDINDNNKFYSNNGSGSFTAGPFSSN